VVPSQPVTAGGDKPHPYNQYFNRSRRGGLYVRPPASDQKREASDQQLFYPFRPAVDADNLALDQHFAEAVAHGGVVGVFRTQLNVVVM